MSIIDTLKGSGLQAGIALIGMFLPSAKPLLDQIQADITAGTVTVENFEATLDAALTTIEGFTGDKWDAALESYKALVHAAIQSEQLTEVAIKG